MSAASGGGSVREGSAKSTVADQISQYVQSTSNLLHLMSESSPSHAQLSKLPKNLLSKTSTIKNTELVLEQMPRVISSLDAHVESGLQRGEDWLVLEDLCLFEGGIIHYMCCGKWNRDCSLIEMKKTSVSSTETSQLSFMLS